MNKQRRLLSIASEWATEIGKIAPGHEDLVVLATAWGFQEVQRGRHPDEVLKEVLVKIHDAIDEGVEVLPPSSKPNGGYDDGDAVDSEGS